MPLFETADAGLYQADHDIQDVGIGTLVMMELTFSLVLNGVDSLMSFTVAQRRRVVGIPSAPGEALRVN